MIDGFNFCALQAFFSTFCGGLLTAEWVIPSRVGTLARIPLRCTVAPFVHCVIQDPPLRWHKRR